MERNRNQNLLESIDVIETRLSLEGEAGSKDDCGGFSTRQRCTYLLLLGNSYRELALMEETYSPSIIREFRDRSLKALETSVKLAFDPVNDKELGVADVTRLLCACAYCRVLYHFADDRKAACALAEEAFDKATLHTNDLDFRAQQVLQRFRDDYMGYSDGNVKVNTEEEASGAVVGDGEEGRASANARPQHNDVHADGGLEGILGAGATGGGFAGFGASIVDIAGAGSSLQQARSVAAATLLIRSLRATLSIAEPVLLDKLQSESMKMRALARIFKAYVRGTALPGQLSGGSTVALDGMSLSFGTFLLLGPYMSWRGFVVFLRDFNIAEAPPKISKGAASFPTIIDAPSKASRVRSAVVREPLVDMKSAAAIFLECSRSTSPVLTLHKFLESYKEIAANSDGTDSWAGAFTWAAAVTVDWDLTAGLNFMQFVDFMGKIALLAYSDERFADALPSVEEKVEHFLSAHLGLMDARKWQPKVEDRLATLQYMISSVGKATPPST